MARRVLGCVAAASGLAACLAGTVSFDPSSAPAESPVNFTLVRRVYVPYGGGSGFGYGFGAAEKINYDPAEKFLYAVSEQGFVNVVDLEDVTAPKLIPSMALDLQGKKLTDVAICSEKQRLFVAHGASDTVSAGAVRVYSTAQRGSGGSAATAPEFKRSITVGSLPDMIAPNHDCSVLAVANEGEGDYEDSLTDPVGSVSLIKDPAEGTEATHVLFDSLGDDDALIAKGVHLPLPLKAMEYWDLHSDIKDDIDFASARSSYSTAMNLEPEYLGWSADGTKVFVSLQENNAMVTVRVPLGDWSAEAPAAQRIDSLGLKDWSASGDTDGIDLEKDDDCVLKHQPGFMSLRSVDSIAVVNVEGVDYILTANEGDDKGYGDFEEKWKAKDLLETDGTMGLDGASVEDAVLEDYKAQNDAGADDKRRLTVGSSAIDYSDPAQPVMKAVVGFGGRGISIYKPTDSTLELVWDSGSIFEREQCKAYPWAHNGIQDEEFALVDGVLYNSSGSKMQDTLKDMGNPDEDGCNDRGDGQPGPCPLGSTVDDRSPKDGAAPEAIIAGVACGRLMAVTATEKQNTAFVFDITDIQSPKLLFVRHLSPASRTMSPELAYEARELGEIDAEGMVFLDAAHSPSGKAGVLFGGSHSGTVSFWQFECPGDDDSDADGCPAAGPGALAAVVAVASAYAAAS